MSVVAFPRPGRPVVYLLHLEWPGGRCTHYLGSTADLTRRLREHRAGRGGRAVAACLRAGGRAWLAGEWDVHPRDDRVRLENLMRSQGRYRMRCDICTGWWPAARCRRLHRPEREKKT